MVIKAILTGGVLSVLAGSIVYFGTEGADTLERDTREDVHLEETELAGAAKTTADKVEPIIKTPKQMTREKKKAKALAEAKAKSEFETKVEQATLEQAELAPEAEAQAEKSNEIRAADDEPQSESQPVEETAAETPQERPKTRWLDQYLKSDKPKAISPQPNSDVIDVVMDKADETDGMTDTDVEMAMESETKDTESENVSKTVSGEKIRSKRIVVKTDGDKEFVWSSDDTETGDENLDMKMIEELFKEHTDMDPSILSSGANTEVRIVKRKEKLQHGQSHRKAMRNPIDYEAVLIEAKKLQVIDMRNQAFLEIVDYAVDRGDVGDAADIVDELSSPELRDTARAKIGVGLAMSGDMEAAFAVLDEIEIDELTAPIRLEIISALMATREERKARHQFR